MGDNIISSFPPQYSVGELVSNIQSYPNDLQVINLLVEMDCLFTEEIVLSFSLLDDERIFHTNIWKNLLVYFRFNER